jgi:hypothetical protein
MFRRGSQDPDSRLRQRLFLNQDENPQYDEPPAQARGRWHWGVVITTAIPFFLSSYIPTCLALLLSRSPNAATGLMDAAHSIYGAAGAYFFGQVIGASTSWMFMDASGRRLTSLYVAAALTFLLLFGTVCPLELAGDAPFGVPKEVAYDDTQMWSLLRRSYTFALRLVSPTLLLAEGYLIGVLICCTAVYSTEVSVAKERGGNVSGAARAIFYGILTALLFFAVLNHFNIDALNGSPRTIVQHAARYVLYFALRRQYIIRIVLSSDLHTCTSDCIM